MAVHEHKYDQRTMGFHQRKMQDSVRDNRGDAWILPGLGEKRLIGSVLIFLWWEMNREIIFIAIIQVNSRLLWPGGA